MKRPETIEIDSKTYKCAGYHPALDEYPSCLGINNLTGIVDYLNDAPENWKDTFIHVEDFDKAVLYQAMEGDFNQRIAIVAASSRPCQFPFGRKMDVEEFIISLHGMFIPNLDRDYLLKLVSGIKIDASANITDDGISQTVAAKQGVSSLITEIAIKNPIELQPFRTFNEVEQPASQFIFRLGKNNDTAVCSLHECDGEAWKQGAIQNIKGFFNKQLPDMPVIA
jgi:hypothetical protein